MIHPSKTEARRFLAPTAYIQGKEILNAFAEHARPLREIDTAYVLGGTTALDRTSDALVSGLQELDASVTAVETGVDTCTADEIDTHSQRVRERSADVVVGVGGGSALDVAKAVAEDVACDVVTVPTVASTDAPCSAVSIVYDERGAVESARFHSRNPVLVLADTSVLAAAPEQYLKYGIGDALATKFEAEAVARSNGTTDAGGSPSYAAGTLASSTYERLSEDGADAIASAADNKVTPAFERVVETVILRSGLGFESGGVAAAHAFHNGVLKQGINRPHGALVSFGTVFQLTLEGRYSVAESVAELCVDFDLQLTLTELGVQNVTSLAQDIADGLLIANEPVSTTPTCVADAIREADNCMRKAID